MVIEDFHVVCGLPRTGSTLLCNILNQNPRFHASSSSCTANAVRALIKLWSTALELKSDLLHDEANTKDKMMRSARALVLEWYADTKPVVFDKCRPWNNNSLVMHHLFPHAHMFVCVRDIRSVFASMQKHHKEFPLLDTASTPGDITISERAERAFDPKKGLIGTQVFGVEDLLRHNHPFVHFIKYEEFVQDPAATLAMIYKALSNEAPSIHDFNNVKNTSTDVDQVWLGKFPHTGSGKVAPPPDDTKDHVSPDIAQRIMKRFALYNQAFGYK